MNLASVARLTAVRWRAMLLTTLVGGLVIALPTWWLVTGYLQEQPTRILSFLPQDGWCSSSTEGIGAHCFGDFQYPRLIAAGAVNADDPYSPGGMLPHLISHWLTLTPLGVRPTLVLYLGALAACLLIPAFVVARGAGTLPGKAVIILALGTGSVPFLMTMDRGNGLGFAVPALMLFACSVAARPFWLAPVALVAASTLRPQFILLALVFLALGRYRALVSSILATLAILVASFALWPGTLLGNARQWLSFTSAYNGYADPAGDFPTNLSATRSLVLLSRVMGEVPGLGGAGEACAEFLRRNPGLPGVILVVTCVAVFWWRRRRLSLGLALITALALPMTVPGTSFGYYLIMALVIAALMLGPNRLRKRSGRWRLSRRRFFPIGRAAPRSFLAMAVSITLVAAVFCSLTPIPIPGPGGASLLMTLAGPLWLIVLIGLMTLAARGPAAARA